MKKNYPFRQVYKLQRRVKKPRYTIILLIRTIYLRSRNYLLGQPLRPNEKAAR